MTIKTRIKTDTIEIEYEGAPEFFKDDFIEVIKGLPALAESRPFQDHHNLGNAAVLPKTKAANGPGPSSTGTTRSIAARLNAKTGPDLLLAAAARLHIVEGRESFKRQDLLEEIKTATGYYTVNMTKNLSYNLKTLFKDGKLIELATEVYTLSAEARSELEQRLR